MANHTSHSTSVEVETERGRIAVGWLIVEDLVMILALVLLPPLAGLLGGREQPQGMELGLALNLGLGSVWETLLATVGVTIGLRAATGESDKGGTAASPTVAAAAGALAGDTPARAWIGARIAGDGRISLVHDGGPAPRAGLSAGAPGMIVGVASPKIAAPAFIRSSRVSRLMRPGSTSSS
jgi:hypothetical protein